MRTDNGIGTGRVQEWSDMLLLQPWTLARAVRAEPDGWSGEWELLEWSGRELVRMGVRVRATESELRGAGIGFRGVSLREVA